MSNRVNNYYYLTPTNIRSSGDVNYVPTSSGNPDLSILGGGVICKDLRVKGNVIGNIVGTVFGSTTNGTVTKNWSVGTNKTIEYTAGFYLFGLSHNDFSPLITFGPTNGAHGAHLFIVTGEIPIDEVTIRVSGVSITDLGGRNETDTQDIIINAGTNINTYQETSKKWIGELNIETISGTPINCNYGLSKYHDNANTDFIVTDIECLWVSDSSDVNSDIELLHHKDTNWTFNLGDEPSHPPPIVSRSTDYGTYNSQYIGDGAWKHIEINQLINGSQSEGIIWRVTSGSTGLGNLSFRSLNVETKLKLV